MTTLLRQWECRRDLLALRKIAFDSSVRMWLAKDHLTYCTATSRKLWHSTEITGLRDTKTRPTESSKVQPVAGQQRNVLVVGRALDYNCDGVCPAFLPGDKLFRHRYSFDWEPPQLYIIVLLMTISIRRFSYSYITYLLSLFSSGYLHCILTCRELSLYEYNGNNPVFE